MIDVEVVGLAEVTRELERIAGQMTGQKILRRAASKSMRPMKTAAKVNAASVKESGAMAAAMSLTTRAGAAVKGLGENIGASGDTAVVAAVFPRNKQKRALAIYNAFHNRAGGKGQKKPATRLRHLHLVEFGTKRTAAKWPLTRAYDATKGKVVPGLVVLLRDELDKL